jgi:hypothetical protein
MNREALSKEAAHLTRSVALLALLSLLGCSGKGVGGACADITACGGDPTGNWKVVSACQFDVEQPKSANDSDTSHYTAPQSPALAPPTTSSASSSGDWCQGLSFITPSDGTNSQFLVRLNSDPVEYLLGGEISVAPPDGSTAAFGAVLTVQHHFAVHFSPTCLGAHGVPPTCDAMTADAAAGQFLNFNDFVCENGGDGGCDCTYLYDEGTTESASYAKLGTQLYIVNATSRLPPRSYDFCVQGDTMTLGGHNGIDLFGSKDLRSVVMTRCATADCSGP